MSDVTNLRKELERAKKFIEHLQETMGLMVPISEDGTCVFIDGQGLVEIDHGEAMRKKISELEKEVEHQKEMVNIAYAAGYYQAECGLKEHDNITAVLENYRKIRNPKRT